MFDEFRRDADDKDLDEAFKEQEEEITPPRRLRPRRILGMNGPQRLIIALMLLFMTCLLSFFFLLVTQKIVPSFLY
jgi:hypothetical protein